MNYKDVDFLSHENCSTNRETIKRLENRWARLIGRLEAKKLSLEIRNNLHQGQKILIYKAPNYKYF